MMIDRYRCIRCKVSYEISWDDDDDIYYLGVEDTDEDINDHAACHVPEHCPFCGNHIQDDMIDEFDTE